MMPLCQPAWHSTMRKVLPNPYRVTSRQRRNLSAGARRLAENTYFPRQAQPPVVVVQSDPTSHNHRSKNIRFFLLGLASFPVLYLAYKTVTGVLSSTSAIRLSPDAIASSGLATVESALGLSPSSASPAAVTHREQHDELAKLQKSEQSWKDHSEYYRGAVRDSDRAGIVAQRLLLALLTSLGTSPITPVKDNELMQQSPVPIPADAAYLRDPAHAQLIRLVDSQGLNRALVLAVDLPRKTPRGTEDDDETEWDRLGPAWRYLFRLADELHHADANGETDIPFYVWTRDVLIANSLAAERPVMMQLMPADMPPGFPMKHLAMIRDGAAAKDRTPDADYQGDILDLRNGLVAVELADTDADDE